MIRHQFEGQERTLAMKKQISNLQSINRVLGILVLGVAFFGCSATSARKAGEIPMPDKTIEVSALIEDFESQYSTKESLEKEYLEKFVAVRGTASAVTMPTSDTGFGTLSFQEKGRESHGVECKFTKFDSEEFSKIKPDQQVTVKGLLVGIYIDAIQLKPCQVVKIE